MRSIVLRLPTGHQTTRPISKLYPLEVEPFVSDTVPPQPTAMEHPDADTDFEIDFIEIEEISV